jgi:hypothetical protein
MEVYADAVENFVDESSWHCRTVAAPRAARTLRHFATEKGAHAAAHLLDHSTGLSGLGNSSRLRAHLLLLPRQFSSGGFIFHCFL